MGNHGKTAYESCKERMLKIDGGYASNDKLQDFIDRYRKAGELTRMFWVITCRDYDLEAEVAEEILAERGKGKDSWLRNAGPGKIN